MVDALLTVKTILDAGWLSANTDSITPTVVYAAATPIMDAANGDIISLYEIDEGIEPFGIGGTAWEHVCTLSCDIRTSYKRAAISAIRAHLIKVKDELYRVIKASVNNPDASFQLMILRRKKDLSDKSRGLGRMVVDVTLKKWG